MTRIPVFAAQAVNWFSAPEHRDELKSQWERGLRRPHRRGEPGSDQQLTFARCYAGAARSDEALADLEALLDGSLSIDGLAVDTDLRWTLLTGLAARGRADDARIDEELAADNTISGKEHAAAARAAMPTAEAKERAWKQAMLDPTTPNETARSVVLSFQRFDQEEVLAPYVDKYLDAVSTTWETLGVAEGLGRAGVHLPQAAGLGRAAREGRRLARDRHRQPRRPALRPRGSRRGRARPRRPGQGRRLRTGSVRQRVSTGFPSAWRRELVPRSRPLLSLVSSTL